MFLISLYHCRFFFLTLFAKLFQQIAIPPTHESEDFYLILTIRN